MQHNTADMDLQYLSISRHYLSNVFIPSVEKLWWIELWSFASLSHCMEVTPRLNRLIQKFSQPHRLVIIYKCQGVDIVSRSEEESKTIKQCEYSPLVFLETQEAVGTKYHYLILTLQSDCGFGADSGRGWLCEGGERFCTCSSMPWNGHCRLIVVLPPI